MFKYHTIGVVIPCYNEEINIKKVINTIPSFVDNIIILEDKVRTNLKNNDLSDITTNYRNFSHDLGWITEKYKELVIELVTENLITDKLLSFYEKSKN